LLDSAGAVTSAPRLSGNPLANDTRSLPDHEKRNPHKRPWMGVGEIRAPYPARNRAELFPARLWWPAGDFNHTGRADIRTDRRINRLLVGDFKLSVWHPTDVQLMTNG